MSSSFVIFFSSTLLNIYIYIYYDFSCIFKKVIFVHESPNPTPITVYDFFHHLKFRSVKI